MDTANITDLLASDEPFEVDLSQGTTVRIAGVDTAVVTTKKVKTKDNNGDEIEVDKVVQVADFIPWLPVTHEAHRITRDGETRATAETRFYPEVITRRGRYRSTNPVSEVVAYDLKKLRSLLHKAGLVLPLAAVDRARLENVISEFGAHDGSRDQRVAYESMGWAKIDGSWTYVAPRGAVTAEGILDLAVTSPGSDDDNPDALPPALAEIGFDRLPKSTEELRDAAGAIRAFIEQTTPDHPAPYLLLGTVFTSVLPNPTQTVANLVGPTGQGKSQLARAALGFFSSAQKVTADLTAKPSLIGLQARAVWSRHCLCVWDDYRAESAAADADMRRNASSLIQMHLTGDDAAKSNKLRGIGAANPVQSFGVLTSEQIIDGGEGIANRLLVTHLGAGDVLLNPRGEAPVDVWRHQWETTGRARAFMAAFLRWLAAQIETAGGLREFERRVDRRRSKLLNDLPTSRTLTSAAMVLTGWDRLFAFAEEAGFDDLLPDWDDIETAILATANAADSAASDQNPARRILEATRDKIAAGAGYVTREFDAQPEQWAALGWEDDRNHIRPKPRADFVGLLTPDSEWIAVSGNWIETLRQRMGITTSAQALREKFLDLPDVHPDSAKAKPSGFGFEGRPRGIYVRTSALVPDLESAPTSTPNERKRF